MIHRFENGELNEVLESNALPAQFTFPFCYVPHPLCKAAAAHVMRYVESRGEWTAELHAGKMLGVLVVRDAEGQLGFLAAFSGNLAGAVQHSYFVPPVYDLLQPDGEFKRGEAAITAINHEIEQLHNDATLQELRDRLQRACTERDAELERYRALMAESKLRRDEARQLGQISPEAKQQLIAESQFQKAELKRLRRRWETQINALQQQIDDKLMRIDALKQERKAMSEALQERIFRLFVVRNARGESLDLIEVFNRYYGEDAGVMPPAGAGECCGPRLLQCAYLNALTPLCMAEFWYGNSPVGEVRHHGQFYPACSSKCKPILNFMLQGLDVEPNPLETASSAPIKVLYEDDWLVAVDKPTGMLSAPGKLDVESLPQLLMRERPGEQLHVVHRLDMATSGVLLLAKSMEMCTTLQRMFAARQVCKCYVAWLQGNVASDAGAIGLPLRPDFDHRPFQVVDEAQGKEAITRYEVVECRDGLTQVRFYPLTGRTHQLRVHAAHRCGLNAPIVGDTLYGTPGARLMLHAQSLTFTHPVTAHRITITAPAPF
ncbi:MAG: RNA pseudouridine synthase [Muribaculaceae bacterium]|nr:RNA pseudouridine synthase [Muribaculaceae bacterium]